MNALVQNAKDKMLRNRTVREEGLRIMKKSTLTRRHRRDPMR